jgi:diphthamide synthase (EF-2-diphthine--ammonia ligase)
MRIALESAARDGVTHVVFGDLFLEDLRAYREAQLARIGMVGVFPLWRRDTTALAREMIDGGLKAHLVCVDPRRMPRRLAGRAFDDALLADLPPDVDPCGENGEFHTFAWDGPMFAQAVTVAVGETVEREGFVFADLVSADSVGYDEHRPAALTD